MKRLVIGALAALAIGLVGAPVGSKGFPRPHPQLPGEEEKAVNAATRWKHGPPTGEHGRRT
jgi:hypothetical protein